MNNKTNLLHNRRERQQREHPAYPPPDLFVRLGNAFVFEAVHLREHSILVVAAVQMNEIGACYFHGQEDHEDLQAVCASIDEVAVEYEGVVGARWAYFLSWDPAERGAVRRYMSSVKRGRCRTREGRGAGGDLHDLVQVSETAVEVSDYRDLHPTDGKAQEMPRVTVLYPALPGSRSAATTPFSWRRVPPA